MDLSSKLGRQMAYKKKLEEEFRLEEERRKYKQSPTYSGYQISQVDVLKQQEILETAKKVQHEKYQEKVNEKSKKYKAVNAKFSEMKKRRLDEKHRIVELSSNISPADSDMDIWTNFDKIMNENAKALKELEYYKTMVTKEEQIMRDLKDRQRTQSHQNSHEENYGKISFRKSFWLPGDWSSSSSDCSSYLPTTNTL